jgi:hypothetical protein
LLIDIQQHKLSNIAQNFLPLKEEKRGRIFRLKINYHFLASLIFSVRENLFFQTSKNSRSHRKTA